MRNRNDGFTLVELMVVVLIIGILVAIAVPVFSAAKAKAEKATCQANQRTILGAVEAYRTTPGATDFALNSWKKVHPDTWTAKLIPTYLKREPKCPSLDPNTPIYLTAPHPTDFRDGYYLVPVNHAGSNYMICGDQGFANSQRAVGDFEFEKWWVVLDHRSADFAFWP